MSDPFKEMVIDAICGAGFSSRNQAVQFGCKRLGRLDGDDVHGKWMWDRGQLIHMDVSALQELYELVKKTQWAIEAEHAAKAVVSLLKAAGPTSELSNPQ